jgi:hypothetical protein
MKVVGFNFTKLSAERYKLSLEKTKINSKMNISSIESIKSSLLSTGEDFLNVEFNYSLTYEPEFANIELKGNVILSVEPKLAKTILNDWKEKTTSEEFRLPLLNIILKKATLKSLELEEELGLPIHLPLPSLKKEQKSEQKEE